MRVRWEWFDEIVNSLVYEIDILFGELSANEKYQLRMRWVFKDMKITFQELFDLGPDEDDKLLPVLSHGFILNNTPFSTFEGLTLRGKDGEIKRTVTRKYYKPSKYSPEFSRGGGSGISGEN